MLAQRVQQGAGGLDRVARQPERPAEHVGAASRHDGQVGNVRYVGGVDAAEQPVDDLVHGAVAAEDDHQVEAVGPGLGRELGGVAAVAGVRDLELEVGLQGAGEHLAGPG